MAYLTNTNVHNACNGKPEMNLTEAISPETDIQEVRILKISFQIKTVWNFRGAEFLKYNANKDANKFSSAHKCTLTTVCPKAIVQEFFDLFIIIQPRKTALSNFKWSATL